jgi:hypothetical protein
MNFQLIYPRSGEIAPATFVASGICDTPVTLFEAGLFPGSTSLSPTATATLLSGGATRYWFALFENVLPSATYELRVALSGMTNTFRFDLQTEQFFTGVTRIVHPNTGDDIPDTNFIAWGNSSSGNAVDPMNTALSFPSVANATMEAPLLKNGIWLLQWKDLTAYTTKTGSLKVTVSGDSADNRNTLNVKTFPLQNPKA